MRDDSLQARLQARLESVPGSRALTSYAPDGTFRWTEFGDLHRRARGVAAVLHERGLRQGDVGLIVLPSTELSAVTTLAMLLTGAIPLQVAPPVVAGSLLDLPRILERTARETQARLIVCADTMTAMRDRLQSGRSATELLFGLEEPPAGTELPPFEPVLPSPGDVAAMQLTSGTTGFPRICVWEQRAVLAALDGMADAMRLSTDDVCLNWTPLYHDMGLVNNFLLCLTAGVPLVMMSPEEFVKRPASWARGLSDTGATVTWSPNFGFALAARRVDDHEIEGVRLDHVHALWNAAERIHYSTVLEFVERYRDHGLRPHAVRTNFGCAENVGGATFSNPQGPFPVEHVDADLLLEDRVARPVGNRRDARVVSVVGVGRPNRGTEIRIISEDGTRLVDGRVGQIAFRTPSRMRGYMIDDTATNAALRGDWLFTGDLGYLRDDELFWVGRSRERITVRGKKLDPSDFEPILFDVEGLREGCFTVFGVDDEERGTQRVVVVSEVREPLCRDPELIANEVHKQTFLRLGVRINEVLLVRPRTLAKTSSGKRRHRHFRRLYLDGTLQPYLVKG